MRLDVDCVYREMFFLIRYGGENNGSVMQFDLSLSLFTADDKKQFFNPDCSLEILVDNIRKRCLCPSDCK